MIVKCKPNGRVLQMIDENIVFVMGAGANIPYGYPSGRDLKQKIIKLTQGMTERTDSKRFSVVGHLLENGARIQHSDVQSFEKALSSSEHASIDAFLNIYDGNRTFQAIGKFCIAYIIQTTHGRPPKCKTEGGESEDDWMTYLFDKMVQGSTKSTFANNNVSFITFNYDTYFDRRLKKCIQYSLNCSTEETEAIFREFRIIHVYGSLDEIHDDENQPTLAHRISSEHSKIKTIYELYQDREDEDHILEARKIVHDNTVIMLGCGLHSENLRLLEIDDKIKNQGTIYATAYGITQREAQRSIQALGVRKDLRHIRMFFGPESTPLEYNTSTTEGTFNRPNWPVDVGCTELLRNCPAF